MTFDPSGDLVIAGSSGVVDTLSDSAGMLGPATSVSAGPLTTAQGVAVDRAGHVLVGGSEPSSAGYTSVEELPASSPPAATPEFPAAAAAPALSVGAVAVIVWLRSRRRARHTATTSRSNDPHS